MQSSNKYTVAFQYKEYKTKNSNLVSYGRVPSACDCFYWTDNEKDLV